MDPELWCKYNDGNLRGCLSTELGQQFPVRVTWMIINRQDTAVTKEIKNLSTKNYSQSFSYACVSLLMLGSWGPMRRWSYSNQKIMSFPVLILGFGPNHKCTSLFYKSSCSVHKFVLPFGVKWRTTCVFGLINLWTDKLQVLLISDKWIVAELYF